MNTFRSNKAGHRLKYNDMCFFYAFFRWMIEVDEVVVLIFIFQIVSVILFFFLF